MRYQLMIVVILISSIAAQGQRRFDRPSVPRPAVAAPVTRGQTLPIKRVILYSNGVAYIERRGTITGHAEIDLSFKQSQVDDVLKSMVVLDLGQGRIGAVSYNSSAPPSARMADIPFAIAAQTSEGTRGGLAEVLAQLQGARVVVGTNQGAVTGSVLTVERRKAEGDQNHPSVNRDAVVLVSESGELTSLQLSDVRSVRLIDDGTRRDLSEFASATASTRRRDAKTITVTSDGDGAREMVVSYTIAAPIWKTTYRVVLDTAGKPFFQGWAIVDNVSDEDWSRVQLSLVSGTPVSFIQPIQQPFYRYRPVVPIPGDLNLEPQIYESGEATGIGDLSGTVIDSAGAVIPGASITVTSDATGAVRTTTADSDGEFTFEGLPPGSYDVKAEFINFAKSEVTDVRVLGGRSATVELSLNPAGGENTVTVTGSTAAEYGARGSRRPRGNRNPTVGGSSGPENNYVLDGTNTADPIGVTDAILAGNSGVATAATGNDVGDLFEYRVDQPVTIPRDRSALIPIIQTNMEGERVSIYNPAVRADRAMGGMLLKNTSALTFEGGSMTILDGNAYAGEALMERLKPAEQRLISFALDLGTLITAKQNASRAPVYRIRAVNGVFQTYYYQTDQRTYSFKNQTDKPRVIYVEHPVRSGWDLDQTTPTPASTTAKYYRFRVELGPLEKKELTIGERHPLLETFQLNDLTRDQIQLFVTQRYIDEPTRQALEHLLDLRAKIYALDAQIGRIDTEIREISEDQARLRENIKALAQTPEARQLIARYVAKADQQQSRIEQLTKDRQAAVNDRALLQQQLAAAIRAFDITREL